MILPMPRWRNRFRLPFATPYFDTLSLELFLATSTTCWGLRMLLTPDAVNNSPSLWWLSNFGTHATFGTVAVGIGLSKFLTLAIGGWSTIIPAILAAGWWAFYTVGLYHGNPSAPGVTIYAVLSLANVFVAGFSEMRDG